VSAKYEFIDGQKTHYPTVKMCEWAQVSRSGYYEWPRPARLGHRTPAGASEAARHGDLQAVRRHTPSWCGALIGVANPPEPGKVYVFEYFMTEAQMVSEWKLINALL
jgi:hypothetical protein